jgi:hypothetical protein
MADESGTGAATYGKAEVLIGMSVENYDARMLERHARGETGTGFDGECLELARHFLDDVKSTTPGHETLLAITIQRAIEGWLEEHNLE